MWHLATTPLARSSLQNAVDGATKTDTQVAALACSDVWNLPATDANGDTYSCGARIEWKQTMAGGALSLAEAKQFVAD